MEYTPDNEVRLAMARALYVEFAAEPHADGFNAEDQLEALSWVALADKILAHAKVVALSRDDYDRILRGARRP